MWRICSSSLKRVTISLTLSTEAIEVVLDIGQQDLLVVRRGPCNFFSVHWLVLKNT